MEKLNTQALLFVVFFSAIVVAGSAVASNATGFATKPTSLTCQDSDGGDVPEVKGVFTNEAGLMQEDYCLTEDILLEMTCNDFGKLDFKRESCSKLGLGGCLNGVCTG